jgi:hypothetical protein
MNDEKDAALGRLLTQKKEKQEHLTLLQSEARRIGQNLSRLGSLLGSHPQQIGLTTTRYLSTMPEVAIRSILPRSMEQD